MRYIFGVWKNEEKMKLASDTTMNPAMMRRSSLYVRRRKATRVVSGASAGRFARVEGCVFVESAFCSMLRISFRGYGAKLG